MTREEAIKMLRGMKADNLNLNDLYTRDKYEALVMAIKALEQEPVLDKIRTEIEQLSLHKAQFLTNDNKVCIDSQEVLNIIDKYKAESEEETADVKSLYVGVNWQYCKNLNDINEAIANHDKDWEGLNDANDIISITYDSNHSSYVVFWKHCTESE